MKISLLICFFIFLCGCSVHTKPNEFLTMTSRAQTESLIQSHYHTISWNPSYWEYASDEPIEYSLFSTTNLVNWCFECFTTDTNAFVTNDYMKQYYIVGAHSK